ncbi:MAG: SDR family NAD(P)-dependent oxidoreductase [bacterium]|nr:SDR family NAD(P)-dependent oxidoreductase [bacterium]
MQNNRIIMITGASSGLGSSLAAYYAKKNYRVCLIARRQNLLYKLQSEIISLGGTADVISCDLTFQKEVNEKIGSYIKDKGVPEKVILNAGVAEPVTIPFNIEDIKKVMCTNYWGALYVLDTVLPFMLKMKSGHIIGISSLAKYITSPGSGAYSASKSALFLMLDSLRKQLIPYKVAVSVICPGFIKTPMTAYNQFPMPLLMEKDYAVKRIVRAIKKKKKVYVFPKLLLWMIYLSYLLPVWLLDKILTKHNYDKAQTPLKYWD